MKESEKILLNLIKDRLYEISVLCTSLHEDIEMLWDELHELIEISEVKDE